MTNPPLRFRLPNKVSDRSVVELLQKLGDVEPAAPSRTRRIYLDTPDWRVLQAGWTLHYQSKGSIEASLVLSSADVDVPIVEYAAENLAQWAADLPESEPWTAVAAAIGERRLLCQVHVESTVKRLAVLDGQRKTTARVTLERHSGLSDLGPRRRIRYVCVAPLRGYEREAGRINALFAAAGFEPTAAGLLHHLADQLRQPTTARHKTQIVSDEQAIPIALKVSRTLSSLRTEILSNEQGVRDQIDIEFLHEFRVAARRARSILNQVADLLPGDLVKSLADDLRWLGTLTGPPRDLDVQLSEADHRGDDLQGLHRLLRHKRADAQIALVGALESPRYQELMDRWADLESAAVTASKYGEGKEPAGDAAGRFLIRAHRRVLRAGRLIDDFSPPETLHELRKKTKAFRYLLEMFAALYSDQDFKLAVRELKALQDNLGEFQDSQVQAASLRTLAEEMFQAQSASAMELMALGRIADSLETRERRARGGFTARFQRFASRDVTKRYRKMFDVARTTS